MTGYREQSRPGLIVDVQPFLDEIPKAQHIRAEVYFRHDFLLSQVFERRPPTTYGGTPARRPFGGTVYHRHFTTCYFFIFC